MKLDQLQKLMVLLVAIILVVVILNAINLMQLKSVLSATAGSSRVAASAGISGAEVSGVIPAGVPEIYGAELGISYSDVSASNPQQADATIRKLGALDNQLSLSGAEQQRYIDLLYTKYKGISCEYCCGARAIIFETGEPACGCAHSYAMRGLAKYLISEHGDEMTDDQIIEEVGKWKTLFFPTQMQQKAQVLKQQGIEFNYINLATNKYRGIEQGAGSASGMVGGC